MTLSNEGLMGFLIHANDDQFLAVRNYTHVCVLFERSTNGKKTMSSSLGPLVKYFNIRTESMYLQVSAPTKGHMVAETGFL